MTEPFLSISEVSKQLELPAHTLRYWEKQFPAVVRPTTGAGGRRYYRAEVVGALTGIKVLLYTHGFTIAGVKKLMHDGRFEDAVHGASVSAKASKSPVGEEKIAPQKQEKRAAKKSSDQIPQGAASNLAWNSTAHNFSARADNGAHAQGDPSDLFAAARAGYADGPARVGATPTITDSEIDRALDLLRAALDALE